MVDAGMSQIHDMPNGFLMQNRKDKISTQKTTKSSVLLI